jgi:hypothetical protein
MTMQEKFTTHQLHIQNSLLPLDACLPVGRGEGEGGRRLRLRPRGASAPEGEPLARRGVDN